ncbi:hypothetical protein SAMN05421504_10150 [Amycolatopsis xylanica]|uniref:Peptidase inhibitor family I36 n=1 Tax=Amycolatopsis xylanica TaxID=589385 RepID=A0A1H2RYT3_9PSEU|nr:hypothetical protein [Amycolatopsis xylanica]SDW24310.1 hypothetical protein SAMN05421504_10150 [Amycolatopsis xylanica]
MKYRMAAAMALAAGTVLAGIASGPASASTAEDNERCQDATYPSVAFSHKVCVTFRGSGGANDVIRMNVNSFGRTGIGHWELFGPHGTISNSLDGEWKDRRHDWAGYQDSSFGDLWCAVFWRDGGGGSGYYRATPPVCVKSYYP